MQDDKAAIKAEGMRGARPFEEIIGRRIELIERSVRATTRDRFVAAALTGILAHSGPNIGAQAATEHAMRIADHVMFARHLGEKNGFPT